MSNWQGRFHPRNACCYIQIDGMPHGFTTRGNLDEESDSDNLRINARISHQRSTSAFFAVLSRGRNDAGPESSVANRPFL